MKTLLIALAIFAFNAKSSFASECTYKISGLHNGIATVTDRDGYEICKYSYKRVHQDEKRSKEKSVLWAYTCKVTGNLFVVEVTPGPLGFNNKYEDGNLLNPNGEAIHRDCQLK